LAIAYPGFDPATGLPVYSPHNGRPAIDCGGEPPIIECDDCNGGGPITATITVTGACDPPGLFPCQNFCLNDVVSLPWFGAPSSWWFGSVSAPPPPGRLWTVKVQCVADVWTITVDGGCQAIAGVPSHWSKVFLPDACAANYPTHSGINMGVASTGNCSGNCIPTIALS